LSAGEISAADAFRHPCPQCAGQRRHRPLEVELVDLPRQAYPLKRW
jgi:hypothetical protein